MPDDAELMAAVARDDEAAFAVLVDRHKDFILNFFVRQGVSYVDGQDLAQQTFLRLWRYRRRYSARSAKLSTFLFLLARQVSIDFFRAETRRRDFQARLARETEEAVPAAEPMEEGERVGGDATLRAFARLSPALRDVLELTVLQDLPQAEAAKVLAIPVGTVKSRAFNALRKMKEYLRHEERK